MPQGSFLRLTHHQLRDLRAGGVRRDRLLTELLKSYPPNTVVRDTTGRPVGYTLRTRQSVKLSHKAWAHYQGGAKQRAEVIAAYRETYGEGPTLLRPDGRPLGDAGTGGEGVAVAAVMPKDTEGWREVSRAIRLRYHEGRPVEVQLMGIREEVARGILVSKLNQSVRFAGSWRLDPNNGSRRCSLHVGTPAELQAMSDQIAAPTSADPITIDSRVAELVRGAEAVEGPAATAADPVSVDSAEEVAEEATAEAEEALAGPAPGVVASEVDAVQADADAAESEALSALEPSTSAGL